MALYSAGDGGSESCVHRRRLGSHGMHRGRPGLCPPRAGGLQIRLGLGRPRALSSAVGLDRQAPEDHMACSSWRFEAQEE